MKYFLVLLFLCKICFSWVSELDINNNHSNKKYTVYYTEADCLKTAEKCYNEKTFDVETHRIVNKIPVEHADLVTKKEEESYKKQQELLLKESSKNIIKNSKGKVSALSKEETSALIEAIIIYLGI